MEELYDFFFYVGSALKQQGKNISSQLLVLSENMKAQQYHNVVSKLMQYALEAKKQFPEKMLDCLSDDEDVKTGALQNAIMGLHNGNVA